MLGPYVSNMNVAAVDPFHLLIQLEGILESDPLIDEVGFIHPTQFSFFSEDVHSSTSLSSVADGSFQEAETSKSESALNNSSDTCFWHNEHKLGISTLVLVQLYKAAKDAFMVSHRRCRMLSNSQCKKDEKLDENASVCSTSFLDIAEFEVMRHSKALLLLSSDFGTAWNSRKLIVSKKQLLPMFIDELLLSALVLSYSPKSERAWSHRRWVIKMIAGKCANLPEIVESESELVKKIVENSKMNYRAWNHRCWLVSYMSESQVLRELLSSRDWAALHVADNSCFHFRARLLVQMIENSQLNKDSDGLSDGELHKIWKVIEKFPHIQGFKPFQVPPGLDVNSLLKYQLAVAALSSGEECTCITGLQLPGVLDELFSYDGPLGATFSSESVSLHLWAPTAQKVSVLIYGEPEGGDPLEVVQLEESNGVWSAEGPLTWEGCYYVYEVYVYHPSTLQISKCIANDPYARGLSADGRRTLFVNVNSEALKPESWDRLVDEKPDLLSFSDISIYELHVRDFSASDDTVPSECRGGYLAFTCPDSAGMLHLKKLSNAGITHIHLLPTYHFAGVDDDKTKWQIVDSQMLESFPPDSDEQQACITAIQDADGYNWGYNPVVWGVPKGSYASNPNGSFRIFEFRKMVQALNRIGVRVVLDVVYNHLHANGPYDENSVLDKIVPGYYIRRNLDGFIEHSTCANNTASEHYMVERLIIDDLLHWATNYKVDGFRFDLMGHIMKRTMVKARSMLQNLMKENDGVEGSSIYIYGEGWNFGEVAENGRGVNASQFNICGTGIGSFNDRIRDAVLGGSPFGPLLQQGFATGLSVEPNDHDHGSKSTVKHMLAVSKDHIQVGMAANLKDYVLTNHEGQEVKGCEVSMHDGVPVAYASSPMETVNYVSAHDNETLFDIVSLKTPINISLDARCRMNHLATSIVALSQGIPFFHAGDEILRSKSLDRDSYNSGDWFNRLDFSYNSNNWGVGLPPKEKNERNWPLMKIRLADPAFKPQRNHIIAALDNFCSLIRIRYSSPLFRLHTANAIQERVRFHNTGPSSIPGVIVMSLEDGHEGVPGLSQLDPIYSYIVVLINVCPTDVTFTSPSLRGKALQLHPVQVDSSDHVVNESTYDSPSGSFRIPLRTTAVFVERRAT